MNFLDKFIISGGKELHGEITVSGAKNAAVAILAASILCDGTCRIENLPNISDVSAIIKVLYQLGANIKYINKTTVEIDSTGITTFTVPYTMTKSTRASSYFMGAMLGRFKRANIAPSGGCDFGVRPIDMHLKGFESLGAKHNIRNGMVELEADFLVGAPIYLDVVSVGATINIILAAVKASGLTIIENAAREPHIVDVANFLNSMGADIRGAGTDTIKIHGVQKLNGTTYSIIPDQIEAGTYMVAAAATGGDVLIKNVIPKHLESISAKLEEAGATVIEYDDSVRVQRNKPLRGCHVKTMPHPGFPTDMQPQMTALLAGAEGSSTVRESVWDNRFRYVEQLNHMKARITVDGRTAYIEGVHPLQGAPVKACDLRAGAAVVIAALMAQGTTEIDNIHFIERGYEDIVEKLTAVGADIRRVSVVSPSGAQVDVIS